MVNFFSSIFNLFYSDPRIKTIILESKLKDILNKTKEFDDYLINVVFNIVSPLPSTTEMYQYHEANNQSKVPINRILIQLLEDLQYVNDRTLDKFLEKIENTWILQQLNI